MYRIVMFGRGGLAHFLADKLRRDRASIVAYADSYQENKGEKLDGIPIININEIDSMKYDYVVIAFSQVEKAFEILHTMGISRDKIIAYSFVDAFDYKENIFQRQSEEFIHNRLNDYLIPEIFNIETKKSYLCSMNIDDVSCVIEKDYVREQTLGLIAKEIYRRALSGNVAELGVFKGVFSKKINYLFPDKKLYLFDTFEGFDERDVFEDESLGTAEQVHDFKNTSIEYVLQQMPNRNMCVVKKGYFPQTFDLQDEQFAFVSIDADLYAPTKAGLEIFWRYLVPGGYIMVHDYNNYAYKGTSKAVTGFCDEYGLSYVPISDINGSVIITKQMTCQCGGI